MIAPPPEWARVYDFIFAKKTMQTSLKDMLIVYELRNDNEEWCPGPESNRHDRNGRGILSPLRLPVSPPGHYFGG